MPAKFNYIVCCRDNKPNELPKSVMGRGIIGSKREAFKYKKECEKTWGTENYIFTVHMFHIRPEIFKRGD